MTSRKANRQANIISILKTADANGLTISEIHKKLKSHYQDNCQRKTIERDIVDLSLLHGIKDSGQEVHPERYSLADGFERNYWHNVNLTEEQLQTLVLSLGMLKKMGPSYFGLMVDEVRQVLSKGLPEKVAHELERLNGKILIADAIPGQNPFTKKQNDDLKKLISSLRKGLPFLCQYDHGETKGNKRKFRAFLLEMVGNAPYLLVEDLDTDGPDFEIKRLKASRISNVSILESNSNTGFVYKDPKLSRYQERLNSFGGLGGGHHSLRPRKVELVVTKVTGLYFEDHIIHSSQKLKWLSAPRQDFAKISFNIPIGFPLIRLFSGFVNNIIDIKPASLKKDLMAHLEAGIALLSPKS